MEVIDLITPPSSPVVTPVNLWPTTPVSSPVVTPVNPMPKPPPVVTPVNLWPYNKLGLILKKDM